MTTTERRIRFGKFLLAGGLLCGAAVLPMMATAATPGGPKVTICHRTDAVNNPYRQITVDKAAVDGVGSADHYGRHQGPLFDPLLKSTHVKWGDIIPPVPGYHNGLNWTVEGRAIYNNGCALTGSTQTTVSDPTATTSTTSTTSTTVPDVTTSTTVLEPTTSTTIGTTTTSEPDIGTPTTINRHGAAVPVPADPGFTG